MAIHLHWFLPTTGDSRDISGFGPMAGRRAPTLDYLTVVARTAEQVGFEAVLTPTGTICEDAWVTTAALISQTERLKFLVAFRPGAVSPTLAAQQARTFQHLSGNRLFVNVVTGGDADEQQRFGDWLDHDQRYDRTDEFLTVFRGAWDDAPFDFAGDHYRVAGATIGSPAPRPPIFFGGASAAAEAVAARQVDVYLAWGEHPDQLAERLGRMRALAAAAGRDLRFGVRLNVIARDRAADAWAEAERLLDAMPEEAMAEAQRSYAATQSVGQQRMAALHGGRREDLVIAPNLWAGFGLVRGGAGTALVGSHDEIADRIVEYHDLGFDHFIFSGQPHVEEALWFGEGVIPRLRDRGVLAGSAGAADPSTTDPSAQRAAPALARVSAS